MPNFTVNQSIAAGASLNLLAGNQLEYLPYPAHMEVGVLGSAAGLTVTIFHGTEVIAESQPVGLVSIAGVFPKYPDDFTIFDDAAMGDRVKILVQNPTAGAITALAIVRINKLM